MKSLTISFLSFLISVSIHAADVPCSIKNPGLGIPQWTMHEFAVNGNTLAENPFTGTSLVGKFTSPSGKSKTMRGFYDGGNTWRLRFVPDEQGEWSYELRGEGVDINQRGKIDCTSSREHGFIHIHPQNQFAFATDDGTPFFPMGDTCYGLHDDSPITDELRATYLQTRRAQHFNFVRMHVGGSYEHAQKDLAYWAWGGTPQNPDLDRFNPAFFQRLDKLLVQMRGSGMNAELILLNFYRRPFTQTEIWTPARERLWLRYLLARYSAFDNIFMWTISNEYETHPDGRYRLDVPGDIEWVKETARFIKENDPYHHMVTVHPVVSSTAQGKSPRDPFELPWQIGRFYGKEDALDILSQQTGQKGDGTTWNVQLQCWEGDDANLVASLQADLRYGKPVLNTENGYEYLRDAPNEKKQVHHTDKVRRSSWRIVCGGGYFAAGFHGTIGHSDVWNRIDAPNHYTFRVESEGAAPQLGYLYQFFSALPFWKMHPYEGVNGNAVVLAEKGKTYVAFFPHGGEASLDLTGAGKMELNWFNPRTGEFGKAERIKGGDVRKFKAPDDKDWTLLLTGASKKNGER
jgi:hypothetical protein